MIEKHPPCSLIRRTVILAAVCAMPAAAGQPDAGLVIAPRTELPEPAAPTDLGLCRHHGLDPQTAGGRMVAAAGWAITDEASLGSLTAISFVAGARTMTSGACILDGGRIGIFDGPDLLALAEGSRPDGTAIGHLRRSGDRLRIWNGGMLSQPVADLMLAEGAPVIVPLPLAEDLCEGRLTMPLIHGLGLADASALLAEHGWEPDRLAAPVDPLAARLAARGFAGAGHCSGTGFGFCTIAFVQDAAAASVLTFGDVERPAGPEVADYEVTCPAAPFLPR